jgi:hypothetical protein
MAEKIPGRLMVILTVLGAVALIIQINHRINRGPDNIVDVGPKDISDFTYVDKSFDLF